MATALPASRGSGRQRDKAGHHLHLHIGPRDHHDTCDHLEDSGIGMDEAVVTKVLATPPTGKKRNAVTTPKSAPASAGPGTGSDSLTANAMSFMSEQSSSRCQTTHSRATHQHVVIQQHQEGERGKDKDKAIHLVASSPPKHPHQVVSSPPKHPHQGANSPPHHPHLVASSPPKHPHQGANSPPHHGSSGLFTVLKESVSRTVSSSSSSSVTKTTSSVDTQRPSFQLGSDSEEESTASGGGSGGSGQSSRRSSQKSSTGAGGRDGKEAKGKGRFRRMLNPLRRSHSAGCDQDVPAHALFLKHHTQMEKKSLTSSQRSVEKSSTAPDAAGAGSDSEGEDTEKKTAKPKAKSLARDLKDKMAFLRRRHTDTALTTKMTDPKSQRPTAEAVSSWNRDLEHLLYDKFGLTMFREFLQSEFSDENLEFWIACEEFKHLKEPKLTAQAQKIYTDFVAVQAPREINLDSKTRMACRSSMAKPNRQTFEQCQKRIQGLMEKDSYPRFLKSETYLELCHELKLNTNS